MQADQELPVRPLGFWVAAYGGAFAVLLAVTLLLAGAPWQPVLVAGVVGGAVFGGIAGPVVVLRQRALWQRITAKSPPLPPGGLRAAAAALRGGPLPDDPQVRRYAAGLAAAQVIALQRRPRWFTRSVFVYAAGTVAGVLVAVAWAPAVLVPTAAMAALLATTLMIPGRARRRYERLTGRTGPASADVLRAPPTSVEALRARLRLAADGGEDVDLWVPDRLTLLGKPVPEHPTGIVAALLTDTALGLGLFPHGTTAGPGGSTFHFRRDPP